jgi:hypothetical protein
VADVLRVQNTFHVKKRKREESMCELPAVQPNAMNKSPLATTQQTSRLQVTGLI